MSRVKAYETGPDDWEVWIALDDDTPNLIDAPYSFCIGHGRTRDEALAMAVADLEAAAETLQAQPPMAAARSRGRERNP